MLGTRPEIEVEVLYIARLVDNGYVKTAGKKIVAVVEEKAAGSRGAGLEPEAAGPSRQQDHRSFGISVFRIREHDGNTGPCVEQYQALFRCEGRDRGHDEQYGEGELQEVLDHGK